MELFRYYHTLIKDKLKSRCCLLTIAPEAIGFCVLCCVLHPLLNPISKIVGVKTAQAAFYNFTDFV
jgi:hypothetical protein